MNTIHLPDASTFEALALFQWEWEALAPLPTTIDDAFIILARNERLLVLLTENAYDVDVPFGCPHCASDWPYGEGTACDDCAWHLVAATPVPCCAALFGGRRLSDTCVAYYPNRASLRSTAPRFKRSAAHAYLQAHVDWAHIVIHLGGTPYANDQ